MKFQIGTIVYKNPQNGNYTNEKPLWQHSKTLCNKNVLNFDISCEKFFINILAKLKTPHNAENEPSNARNGLVQGITRGTGKKTIQQ